METSTAEARCATAHSAGDASAFQARLGAALGTAVDNLRVLASGWETTVFEFTLTANSTVSPDLPVNKPLVLRFYEGSQAAEKARREYPAMRELARHHFPVPHPYLHETRGDALGAPFMIMERVAGGPLFAIKSFPQAFKTFSLGFIGFVRAQARLHRLSAAATSNDSFLGEHKQPLLDRMLELIANRVEQGPLPGLVEGLAKLRQIAAQFKSTSPALLHLDYHPQNVIVKGTRVTGVIDWVNAARGDRHLDAATTAVILATSAMTRPRWMDDNAAGNSLRRLFTSLYVPMYHALAPMEFSRFHFYQGVAALVRLSTFGMMRTRGPASIGYRPESIENVTPSVVRLLSRYASRKTGVPVHL
jgi:aminoglycoside phosphotransferase (APT) family kinase protein